MNNRFSFFISYLYCGLLIWYSYLEMSALGSDVQVSSNLVLSKAAILIISLLLLPKGALRNKSPFSTFWIAWVIWLSLEFLAVLVGYHNPLSFLHCFFAPFCFLLVYSLCLLNSNSEKHLSLGFIYLYLFCGLYSVILSFTNNITTIEAGTFVSNLVFWSLCPFVFVTLIKKTIIKYLLFIPMLIFAILLAKRSAMIIFSLELLIFSYYQIKGNNRKRGWGVVLLYIIIGIAAYVIVTTQFSQFVNHSLTRFTLVQEDRGSHRLDIYYKTFENIENFTVSEYLFGRGFGSFVETGHTNAHNDALQLFYEYGFVGLAFYVVFIVLLIKRSKVIKKYMNEYYIGYLFCIITVVVLGVFSNLITFNSYFAFVCSYIAMAEASFYKRTLHVIKHNSIN